MSDLIRAFPAADTIPAGFRYTPDDTGLTLLLDGRLERWGGPAHPIGSAVDMRDAAGRLQPIELGPAAAPSATEGLRAVDTAVRAWKGGRGEWPRASVAHRIACSLDFVKRARPLREQVARALMWEVGKPWTDCLVEIDRTLQYVEDTAETLRQLERESGPLVRASGYAARIRRAPLGVALCMGPYNYAVNEVYTTVIPALVMGNPVVIKTPRYGILANALLAPALLASFPPGVVSMITGDGPTVVGPIVESGKLDVLALIGSARTAALLLRQHPKAYRLRTILGMGAKNPAIVLRDADLDLAAKEIVSGALTFNGQRCTALKHVLVEQAVAEPLVERLAALTSALRVGMPWEEGVTITPMPDPEHVEFLTGLLRDAGTHGARIVNTGGGEYAGKLFRPALVYPVPSEAQLFTREQFGPIVPVSPIASPDEALDIVNRSGVGQQASIFGRDPSTVGRLVDQLANLVCRVNLNAQCRRGPDAFPFTGRKDSAVGTLSIYDALRSFSIRSMVAVPEHEAAALDRLVAHARFLEPPA